MTFAEFVGRGSQGLIGAINLVVIPVLIAIIFAYFVWGIIDHFFIHGDDETKRTEGRSFVIWGILGITLIFAVWGVVNIALSTFGLEY